jgi:hypothetical protein
LNIFDSSYILIFLPSSHSGGTLSELMSTIYFPRLEIMSKTEDHFVIYPAKKTCSVVVLLFDFFFSFSFTFFFLSHLYLYEYTEARRGHWVPLQIVVSHHVVAGI